MKKITLLLYVTIFGLTCFAQNPVDGKHRTADSATTYLRSSYPVTPAGASDVKLRRSMRAIADMIQKHDTVTVKYKGRDSLNFPSITAGTCAELTLTVTGAAVSDIIHLGIPQSAMLADVVYFAWVSSTNVVTIRACNNHTSAARDPAIGLFKVAILK